MAEMTTLAVAGDFDVQLMLPDANVSSRPVIEFRARKATTDPVSPGHAYILLGRELDNGLRVYNTVAGFYPDDSRRAAPFMQVFSTKGKVTQKLEDAKSELTLSTYITPIEEQRVVSVLKSYDTKNYSLAVRNCVTMTKDVAAAVGLSMPGGPENAVPQVFLQSLIDANRRKAPVPGPAPQDIPLEAPNAPEPPANNAVEAGRLTIDLTRPPVPVVPPLITPPGLPPEMLPAPPPIQPPALPPILPPVQPPVLMPPPN
ncbi:MAG: hypothetical protein EOQ40_15055 [Mesorhizobium sp.]|uniref:hypothetical protein n=1 Tax=Mesorhizobium sp. TaxID=1871066 RepID=UPI000FEA2835|nr:hypothetical protein [Mesorhizobium sp.]RWB20383.1 MAG: hypothetical protein EOQ40_15055 [Mesorhizobium sp.]